MKMFYKIIMFLMLMLFCVGSVCAADPDNTTSTNLTDNQNVINIVTQALEKKDIEIKTLQDNDIKQSNEIQQLKDNNTQLDKRVKDLEYSKLTQSNRIKSLEIDIKNLEDSNKQLINSNKLLIDSNKQKDIDIKELKDSNKQLVESNKVLNDKINNQSVIISELNNKLDLQVNEIKQLQADKDKLNAEIKQTYEKLLNSPKKEDFDQLKKEIDNKNKQIDKLNNEINTLRAIISVNGKDVYNSLKGLSTTNIQNIKCGKYTFKLEDYLKIPLIKNGKDRVIKYKKSHGRLPNYVTIAGYEVPKNVYKKLYNIK